MTTTQRKDIKDLKDRYTRDLTTVTFQRWATKSTIRKKLGALLAEYDLIIEGKVVDNVSN